MLVRRAEVDGALRDIRISDQQISEVSDALAPRARESVIEAGGAALIPGLHDHHIHLLSLAAALESVSCGPPEVSNEAELRARLESAAPIRGWIRGTGYFESVAGQLDRDRLDALCPNVPLRIQHRSGVMWFLNSAAIEALDLEAAAGLPNAPAGLERDSTGRISGRIIRLDEWLRTRMASGRPPDLSRVGRRLSRVGVTGVTDASPRNALAEWNIFEAAQQSGALPQHLCVMGCLEIADCRAATTASSPLPLQRLQVGPHKLLFDEGDLPDLAHVVQAIEAAHGQGRIVAVHTVTRAEIHFALAAIEAAGALGGDRLEHASIAPPEVVDAASRLGLTIVTQPNFVAERGDAYREDVAQADQAYLYQLASWKTKNVALGGGTDAPFGSADPWRAMRAAVERKTASGAILGPDEALTPERALALFTTSPQAPGGECRRVDVGAAADLCLLDAPWAAVRGDLDAAHVRMTIRSGEVIWNRDSEPPGAKAPNDP